MISYRGNVAIAIIILSVETLINIHENDLTLLAQNGTEDFSASNELDELVSYENAAYGIYLYYPENWEVTTPDKSEDDRTEYIVTFTSPNKSSQ